MIRKKNSSYGLNTNVHIDTSASTNGSSSIKNHIDIRDAMRNGSSATESSRNPQQSLSMHVLHLRATY